jgi:hypothetical protein
MAEKKEATLRKLTTANLTRMRPNTVECTEAGCTTPRGATGAGFTDKGLILHKSLKHGIKAAQDNAVSETPKKDIVVVNNDNSINHTTLDKVDYGTPGDEVVMGGLAMQPNWAPMDDVKHVVDTDWEYNEYVTPAVYTDEAGEYVRGWRVRGRKQCCDRKLEHSQKPNYHCLGDWVANQNYPKDPKTGWRVIDGVRMKPIGPRVNQRIVEEADKRFPYESYSESAPVGSADAGGPGYIRIKARDKKLYVELDDKWQEMSLEQFINNVRFAVNIS